MLIQKLVGQPGTSAARERNVDALVDLVSTDATAFDAAIAYVTDNGVDTLLQAIESAGASHAWDSMKRRFLVSCDWLRSDPSALERLAGLPAAVRVHDGTRVVAREGCIPYTPWHPKWFSVHGSGTLGVFCGSGNLSRNGLLNGHEAGILQMVKHPTSKAERQVKDTIDLAGKWFERHWHRASPLNQIMTDYRRQFSSQTRPTVGRNDESSDPSGRVGSRHALTAEQISALTSAPNFWIEGGRLSRNRGPSRPGNQLMMSALMRVFFGAPATEVDENSAVGRVDIEHPTNSRLVTEAPIRFSDNSMDVITLPVPETPWPTSYDEMALLFTKVARGRSLHYVLVVRDSAGSQPWRAASAAQGTSYAMRSGREWGVFG